MLKFFSNAYLLSLCGKETTLFPNIATVLLTIFLIKTFLKLAICVLNFSKHEIIVVKILFVR